MKTIFFKIKLFVINLLNHQGFRRYFANTGWMFFGQASNIFIAFFLNAYIARYLGPSNYGVLNYAISFAGLFVFMVGFGIDGILSRDLLAYPERKNELLGSGFWVKLFGAFLAILFVNTFAWIFPNSILARTLIFIYSLTFIFLPTGVISIYFQSKVLAKNNFKAQFLVTISSTILKLILVLLNFGVIWLTAVYVWEGLVGSAIFYYLYKKDSNKISWTFDWLVCKKFLADSWPLMFSTVAMYVYLRIDQTMLKYMLDEAAVGVYAVAVKLSEVWYIVPNLICASIFPAILNAKKTNIVSYQNRLSYLYKLMLFLAFGVIIGTRLFGKLIINKLFGSEYEQAIELLYIYSWSSIAVFLMAAVSQYLIAENLTKLHFVVTVFGAIVNIALNLVFIPKYGIIGSAYATLISYFLPLVMVLMYNSIGIQLKQILVKTKI